MAFGEKKPGGVAVDIVLPAPKRKPGAGGDAVDPGADPAADDVQGEMITRRVLKAFDAGDAAALNAALKAHYEHCRDAGESDEPTPESEPGGGLFGAGGRPGEAY